MPQKTNLNVSPYFDDFEESKNYQKVLFKPGSPVQARELTTLQTILQNQIEKFGNHFFKEGAMVIPGQIAYDSEYVCVQIDETHLGLPISLYLENLVGKLIQGENAVVVDFYAKWCAPCLKMMPTVDKLSNDYKGKVTVLKVEADGNQAVLQKYEIDEIPSFLVFRKGKLLQKTSGFREEAQLKELFDQSIGTIR